MTHAYYVYILTNRSHTTLYVGVTNNLESRLAEHRNSPSTSFVARYNVLKLVHYEQYSEIEEAIRREKQLKGGSRKQKIALILEENPGWRDLSED